MDFFFSCAYTSVTIASQQIWQGITIESDRRGMYRYPTSDRRAYSRKPPATGDKGEKEDPLNSDLLHLYPAIHGACPRLWLGRIREERDVCGWRSAPGWWLLDIPWYKLLGRSDWLSFFFLTSTTFLTSLIVTSTRHLNQLQKDSAIHISPSSTRSKLFRLNTKVKRKIRRAVSLLPTISAGLFGSKT